jgi:hypothetical protein
MAVWQVRLCRTCQTVSKIAPLPQTGEGEGGDGNTRQTLTAPYQTGASHAAALVLEYNSPGT